MSIFEQDKEYIVGSYNRFPIEIVKGKGSLAYDADGKEYIDLGSGIAVNTFGYSDEEWIKAVESQLGLFQHTSNLYYTKPCVELAKAITERTGMSKVFFGNSGAEANECLVKVARKWAAENKGENCYTIVTLENSFHGRTLTTLALTGQDHYHELYQPLTPGFKHIEAGNIEEAEYVISRGNVAAVIIETVQGEGGVNVIDKEYVEGLYQLCKKYNVLFMVDEVQTGNGRTGKLYSYMHYDVEVDAFSTAKGLGGGLPIGACVVSDKLKDVIKFGDHGSTFGGNPIACAGGLSIINRLDDEFLAEVAKKGDYIVNSLKDVPGVESISHLGMMIGIKPTKDVAGAIVKELMNRGVLALTAKNKVRLLPALNIDYPTLDKALDILKTVLKENA